MLFEALKQQGLNSPLFLELLKRYLYWLPRRFGASLLLRNMDECSTLAALIRPCSFISTPAGDRCILAQLKNREQEI